MDRMCLCCPAPERLRLASALAARLRAAISIRSARRGEAAAREAGFPASAVLQDAPQRAEAVLPADVLAFLVGAAVVGDADLVYAEPRPRDTRRDLRLEAEPVLLERGDIKKACPGATVKSGLSVTGSEAANAAGRVQKWLAANGLI